MLPDVPVDHNPVGIKVIWPPAADNGEGAVIVFIVVVPDIKVIAAVGAIVAELAIVGAAADVAIGAFWTIEPYK